MYTKNINVQSFTRRQTAIFGNVTALVVLFKKATKIEQIFTVDLTVCNKCQIDGEDFVTFCGLLKKHEL